MKNDEIMLTIQLFLQVQQNVDLFKELESYLYIKNIHLPIQLRDPAENGIKANGERSSVIRGLEANRSGSNLSGFGKTFGSL